jgi:hypothetical protein
LIVDGGMDAHLAATRAQFATLTQQAAAPAAAPAAPQGAPGAAPAVGPGSLPTAGPGGVPGAAPAAGPAATPAAGTAASDPATAAAAASAPVPATSVKSGYRNPQRNKAVGSQHPSSRHVSGTALDLGVAGANATLWARLRQAGASAAPTSICEIGATEVPCNDPDVNHVHIQW